MNLCGAIFILLLFGLPCLCQHNDGNTNKTKIEWKGAPKLEAFENYEEMESYFNATEKTLSLENPKNDTYIEAYNLHHIEPSKSAKRFTKRSTPMFIKFELSDVREPDEATKEFFKKIHKSLNISQLMNSTEKKTEEGISEENNKEKKVDIEKRSISLFNTGSSRKNHKKSVISTNELNKIMKLVIDINKPSARKQYNNEPPGLPYVAGLDHRYTGIAPNFGGHHLNQFGEKYKQYPLAGSQQFVYTPKHYQYPTLRSNYVAAYMPHSEASLKAAPLTNLQTAAPEVNQIRSISRPDSAQVDKILPEINYVIKEVPAPDLNVPQPISHQHSSVAKDQTSEIDYRSQVYGPAPARGILKEQRQQQIGYTSHAQVGNKINNEYLQQGDNDQLIPKQAISAGLYPDPKYGTLMTLVGKPPADQLYGLTYILGKELHLAQRPEDSTSPMVFHPDASRGVENADATHGVHLSYIATKNEILGQAQDIKPITEAPEEELQVAPVVHVTPQPQPTALSYKQLHSALSPNYELQDDEKQLQQYASRYAFGYHVRDFHSGNDYGHRQNRDLDGVTRGQYHILLPDGRIQNVVYHADDSGFHADVSFESGIDHHHHR